MPSINLTERQLKVLAAAVGAALQADEDLGKLAARGFADYQSMPGASRRELFELWAVVDALAREHAERAD